MATDIPSSPASPSASPSAAEAPSVRAFLQAVAERRAGRRGVDKGYVVPPELYAARVGGIAGPLGCLPPPLGQRCVVEAALRTADLRAGDEMTLCSFFGALVDALRRIVGRDNLRWYEVELDARPGHDNPAAEVLFRLSMRLPWGDASPEG